VSLTIVGTGYGADVTSSVAAALGEAEVVIGHEVFLDTIKELIRPEAERFDVLNLATPEEDVFAVRTRVAAERAATGARVVLVSGGDPGLLGMAGPVFHNLKRILPAEQWPEVRVLPGLSAWQYASAALGAPFNGGVAVLSLCLYSHTEDKIGRQIAGVAASGVGTVVYMLRHNGEEHPDLFPTPEPAAALAERRFTMLRDSFLAHRPGDTPCFLLTGIGRPESYTCVSAPLSASLDLWHRSGPESVFCVPGEDHELLDDRVWALT
jgi:precorrin-3B methylase